MNLKVLGCQPMRRELYALAALSPHEVELDLISPDSSLEFIQQKINAETQADYIVLALGECSAMGICSVNSPLVIARVHNCPHLLLGSTERYHKAFSENEDSPRWQLSPQCSKCMPKHGEACVVKSSLVGSNFLPVPSGMREYASDLSLLKKLLNGEWDEQQILVLAPHNRIVSDPVDILSGEPV